MSAERARPQKVTLACLIAGMSAALMLVYIFATMSDWASIELQEQIRSALEQEPLREADLAVADVLGWLRVALMVCAALAVSGVILAVYTARGHRGARIGLTVLAAASSFAFVAFGLAGLLPAAMAALCVFYLWSGESRAWFRGEAAPAGGASGSGRPDPFAVAPRQDPPPVRPADPGSGVPTSPAPPAPGQPRPSERPFAAQAPVPAPVTGPRPGHHGVPAGRPPRAVGIAVIVTSVMAGLVGLVCGLNALIYLLSPTGYRDLLLDNPMLSDSGLLEQTGMTATDFARLMFISTAIGFVLALAAISAALLLLKRAPAARVALTVLAALTIGLSIAAFPPGLIWAGGTIYVLVLLYRTDVNRWFRAGK